MDTERPSVSVVIPTLNAEPWLADLLKGLSLQKPEPPGEVILVDSGSTDNTLALADEDPRIRVVHISEFSHGGARNLGIQKASGDIVVLMTQDAEPADKCWLRALIEPLADDRVAAVYSRQVPRSDASPMERFFLLDRFPAGERVVRQHKGDGIPVYPETFFSNVSSAALRQTWLSYPFNEKLLMSEDQEFARDVLLNGKAIVYEPASVVLHSHTYNLRQTFQRYFDSVVAFRQLATEHGTGESINLAKSTLGRELKYMLKEHPFSLPYYSLYKLFKAAGVLAGHFWEILPRRWCQRFSLNPGWWKQS